MDFLSIRELQFRPIFAYTDTKLKMFVAVKQDIPLR